MSIFDKLETVFGSQAELAKAIGERSRQTVGNWKARGRIPAEKCQAIAAASQGRITVKELRPDIYQ